MNNLMREEFEKDWGFTNEEQECYFIPELNCYGSARLNNAADSKSRAWVYFQRGWKNSRECLVVELPKEDLNIDYSGYVSLSEVEYSIHAAGVKFK